MSGPDYRVSTDPADLDLELVHRWLSTDAYWALGRSLEAVRTSVRNSISFGAFTRQGQQVAYARVVTDRATFAWLCDVYVAPRHRGRGVGSTLVRAVLDELEPMGLGRVLLATADAHEVYARHGFLPLPEPQRWMVRPGGPGPAGRLDTGGCAARPPTSEAL